MRRHYRIACLASLAALGGAAPALAHHPMGGTMPVTVLQGLLSGFGHPVLGLDHLAALVVVGLLASRAGTGWFVLPSLWVAAMGAGVIAHLAGIDLPGAGLLVAGGLVAMAAIAVSGRALPLAVTGPVFAVGGIAHGHALAETIVGAEPMPIVAYLTGLVLVQAAVTSAVAAMARHLFPVARIASPAFRAAAAAMGAVGLVFLAIAARAIA